VTITQSSAESTADVTDILIIGGGPTGLFASFYCGMRNATSLIIDSLPELGGQLATLYPEKYIYDVAGFPKVLARDLVEQLKIQAMAYQPKIQLGEAVQQVVRREDEIFEVMTDKNTYFAKAIIICAGIGAFSPRPLPAASAQSYNDKGVYYYIDSLEKFRDLDVLVVGGGDSALDYALMAVTVAKSVTLIHRRDEFRAHEETVKQLHQSSIAIRTFCELSDVMGDGQVEQVAIVNNQTKEVEILKMDAVVSGLGFSASLGPIQEWGIEVVKNEIPVNTRMETNVPGIYAAGDVVTYPGKVKLIATGFGEAPTAVNNAKTFIDPKAKLSPGHSSSRKE
jgi:ferredoxin/flavodoxin---NADP+ reductase